MRCFRHLPLSLLPGAHVVEGENQFPRVVIWPLVHNVTHVRPPPGTINKCNTANRRWLENTTVRIMALLSSAGLTQGPLVLLFVFYSIYFIMYGGCVEADEINQWVMVFAMQDRWPKFHNLEPTLRWRERTDSRVVLWPHEAGTTVCATTHNCNMFL